MVGLGIAWASIIALPYAMLANNLPSRKMGVNMGIFNIFIVIPQLLAAAVLTWLLGRFAGGDPVVRAGHRRGGLVPGGTGGVRACATASRASRVR